MLVPQSVAYALLAGLPPAVGLYSAMLPLLAYAVFGTSSQLAVGPAALESLLVLTALSRLASRGSASYLELAGLLTILVGLWQGGLGLLRLGALARWLTPPVVRGFTTAAALLIVKSQLVPLLGISGGLSPRAIASVADTPSTAAVGFGFVALLLVARRRVPRWPGALLASVLGVGLTVAFDLRGGSIAMVGAVHAGLPRVTAPNLSLLRSWPVLFDLVTSAAAIAVVSFVGSTSVARVFEPPPHPATARIAPRRPSRELLALGLANLVSALSGGLVVTGGLSRTAVAARAGARTRLTGVVAAAGVAVTVLVAGDLFAFLPHPVLAAVIVTAMAGLVDRTEWIADLRARRPGAAVFGVTVVATLWLGIVWGVGAGAAVSALTWRRSEATPLPPAAGRVGPRH